MPPRTQFRVLPSVLLLLIAPAAHGDGPPSGQNGGTPTIGQRCEIWIHDHVTGPVIQRTDTYLTGLHQTFSAMGSAIAASPMAGVVPDEYPPAPGCPKTEAAVTADIRTAYQATIKPIFQDKCFACHNKLNSPPWYAFGGHGGSWNQVQQDIDNGRAALEMSLDYPFMSAAKLKQPALLKKIRDAADKGNMPPLKYRAVHWGSGLSEDDKAKIRRWVDDSQAALKCIVDAAAAPRPSPAAEVKKLFEDKCVDCHNKPGKRKIGDIMDLTTLGNSAFVDRANPDNSGLLRAVTTGDMPKDDAKLSEQEVAKIRDWIRAGAPAQ